MKARREPNALQKVVAWLLAMAFIGIMVGGVILTLVWIWTSIGELLS